MKLLNLNTQKRWVVLCIALLYIGVFASAQQNYDFYQNVSLEQNASSVRCFIQDDGGMVWIGTDKGLYNYDGYAAYPHYAAGKKSNTHINCGIRIGHSYLYLGSDNGLLVFNYRKNQYEDILKNGPSDVRSLALDGNKLWIGSLNGLYQYNLSSKRLLRFDANKYYGIPHNTIYSIIKTSDERVYFGTYNGFCFYDSKKKIFQTLPLPQHSQKSNIFVNALLEDKVRHCIWIGTEGNLYQYEPATGKVRSIDAFRDNSIKVLSLDKGNRLLIGTDNGLHVYSERGGDKLILHDSRNISSLANDIIWSIFLDSDYNVWIGTDCDISINAYSHIGKNVPISQITGRSNGNQFYCIYKDARDRIWLGGSNGLIQTLPSLSGSEHSLWYRVADKSHSLTHNRIRKIVEDRNKQLWIATDGGILRYDEARRQWIHYNLIDKTHRLNANWAYDLFEDTKGRLWVATCLGGVFVVDKRRLEQSKGYCEADYNINTSNGLAGMFVNQIAEDRAGNVWTLLYNNAIQKINSSTMRVTTVSSVRGFENLGNMLVDAQNRTWVTYRGGVLCILPGKPAPFKITFSDRGQALTLAMTEIKNEIWMSTTDGVWVVDKRSMRAQHVGNMSKSFTSLYYNAASNLIYFGYKDGVFTSTPQQFRSIPGKHPLQLTAVTVNNVLWTQQKDCSVRYAQTLYFKSGENHIDFSFSDLPYALDEKGKFVYKLQGVDKEWNVLPINSNHITFDNLDPGKYVLLVSRIDANTRGNAESLEIHFVILPPWYYTSWAKSFYTLVVLLLFIWVFNFYKVKSRLRLERMEKQQIIEQTKLKLDFFANISHDFKTPLSMIIAPISRLLLEPGNVAIKKQLELVQSNAMKINSMIHRIIDFDRIDNNAHTSLLYSKVDYVDFIRNIFNNFQEGNFKEKKITGHFESNVEQLYQDIDVLKMESVITNILSNAAKYTPQGGEVFLLFEQKNNKIQIIIRDTGIGIPAKDLPYVSQRFFQSSKTSGKKEGTGIGLYLARAYTELHDGTFDISSEEGKGTSITLTFPCTENNGKIVAEDLSDANLPLALIVDDSNEVASFVSHILQDDFRCEIAYDGKEGLRLCKKLLPNLVVADMMMPVMNGLEMCQQIRKNVPTSLVPIIMLTAKDDKQTEIESIRLNIDAFLPKPFDSNVLLLRARQLVGRHNLQEKKERIENISAPKEIVAVSQDEKFLSQITQFIEDHIDDFDLNVNSLCEKLGFGNKTLYRKLKQLTGMSPVDYIKSIRMKKAAMLLKQQKFTVAEVMYMVGFSNTSYFSKCFQSAFGTTPRQYMEAEKH